MWTVRRAILTHWPADERTVLVSAASALFASFLFVASWGVVILPVQRDFGAGGEGEILLRQLPDIAGLFTVPVVGALGARIKSFRIVTASALTMLLGASAMVLASGLGWLVSGMCLAGVGRAMLGVVAFAAVGECIRDEGRRASAFAVLGAAPTLAFAGGPVLAGWLMGAGDWRLVGAIWLASAAMVLVSAWGFRAAVSTADRPVRSSELGNAVLAGCALVGVVQSMGSVAKHGPQSPFAVAWMGVTLATILTWAVTRRKRGVQVDGPALRIGGLWPVLVVAMLAQCGDLWFYLGALARFMKGLTPLEISLALLPAQAAGVLGAALAGRLIRGAGLRLTGTVMLGAFSAAMLASCMQSVGLPLWVSVALLCVAAAAELGAGVCVSQAVIGRAPAGFERQVSACRTAATGIGNAMTLLLVATSVQRAMAESMRERAEAEDMGAARVEALVTAVRENVPNVEVAAQLGLSPVSLDEFRETRREVMVDGFREHGLVSGGVLAVAAAGFWFVHRSEGPRPTGARRVSTGG